MQESNPYEELLRIVWSFNNQFSSWEVRHHCGANFRFVYDPSTGRKMLEVTDIAPEAPEKPSTNDKRIAAAESILEAALKETLDAATTKG